MARHALVGCGYRRPGDRGLGSPIELTAQDRVRALRDTLLRTELLPAFEMSAAKLDGFVARIRERRPKMLFGYPGAVAYRSPC